MQIEYLAIALAGLVVYVVSAIIILKKSVPQTAEPKIMETLKLPDKRGRGRPRKQPQNATETTKEAVFKEVDS